jgi:hypothetical protein
LVSCSPVIGIWKRASKNSKNSQNKKLFERSEFFLFRIQELF